MDNQRLLVWATFGLMAFLTYEAWMQDYGPKPVPVNTVNEAPASELSAPADDTLPTLNDTELPLPSVSDTPALPAAVNDEVAAAPTTAAVRVTTDVLELEINTQGGTLQLAKIRKYPVAKDQPDTVITLLSTERRDLGLIQTGLRSADGGAEANQNAMFAAPKANYTMSGDELVVPLTWRGDDGVVVTKRYRFKRGSYQIDVEQTVQNGSASVWRGAQYAQLHRRLYTADRSMFDVDSYSFDGPIIYDGEKSTKLDHGDLADDGPMRLTAEQGWVGAIQHHFLSAIIPPADAAFDYAVALKNEVATASLIGRAQSIEPGDEHLFTNTLFVGPKLQSQLEDITPKLKLTVDYGWLTIISEPLFWLLSKVFSVVQNWGVAIIIVTILIKLVFYKLTEASGRSMAKMRKIQPRMKALQERYKDDRQALSQAMMDLYKREKVNPAAGCLPILIQMPFFLAFYWVLLESVEMRQAPFALWITDLSSRDPYFILPIIMGAAMLGQQKLNPAPADPMQAKVMQIMPIVFTAFFAFFPAGLVLYWVTNTLLS
ncbi:MAG: membrane protein insertase YidC, partial [Woeseia sp.]|nr:membrane protein insertase YidC [Woeseia sp.]